MTGSSTGPPRALGRRAFVLAAAATGLGLTRERRTAAGPAGPGEGFGPPRLRLPRATGNGSTVPIVVEMDHPMEPGHHVTSVHVVNDRDPLPSKGVFHFTPANGEVYLAFQARLDDGESTVRALVECSRAQRWSATADVRVAAGGGGCVGAAPPAPAAIRPPVIRLPGVVRGQALAPGQVVDVQVAMQHPVRTGLGLRGGEYVAVSEPFYLTEMEVFHGGARASRFALTPALSDNPLIAFRLRLRDEGAVAVVVRNSRGAQFEATHPIRFG